ncbi:MAG: hypothetical protein ACQCN5_08630 [Candidatus Bathyarchaeia archaeon]|jgi:hypothetical protein
MKRKIALSTAIIFLLLAGLIAYITYTSLGENNKEQKPFHVGVAYCGNSVPDAKALIDKVANYTNLFVLQSGTLMHDKTAITAIGDYAVNAGLDIMVYFGSDSAYYMEQWLETYDGHWGNKLAGIYFNDEPAGKMLDGEMPFFQEGKSSFRKMANRAITGYYFDENTTLDYYPDGKIIATVQTNTFAKSQTSNDTSTIEDFMKETMTQTTYYPNGTTTTSIYPRWGGSPISSKEGSDLSYTYEELWNARPLQTVNETSNSYIDQCNTLISRAKDRSSNFTFNNFLTADYALYWFDYKGGYDTVLAELGWNNTVAQEIGLVRGAANLQGKDWGTIITWKYTHAPYLTDGDEMFEQMKTSYEAGAQYVVIFNYAEDMSGPYGTLKEEHFEALEHFWNDVVQNPSVTHGGIKAEAALVLPYNYGWGMRRPDDTIWGLWDANDTSTQIWNQLQQKLEQYGLKLDIIYDDPACPASGKYNNIYFWNKTP